MLNSTIRSPQPTHLPPTAKPKLAYRPAFGCQNEDTQSTSSLGALKVSPPTIESVKGRISDPIYHLFLAAPKNEIHVHQSGSSSLEFLNYSLRAAISRNQSLYDKKKSLIKEHAPEKEIQQVDGSIIKSLPLYPTGSWPEDSQGRQSELVHFTEPDGKPLAPPKVLAGMEKVLTMDNLREYFRFQLEEDDQKDYLSSRFLAETTSKGVSGQQDLPVLDELRHSGLNSYRKTSVKINPYVKNNPAAYILANQYAHSMAFENVRYTEYRVSPAGNGIGGNYSSGIEELLSAVNDGFRDAKAYLKQRTYDLDYGLIILLERQARPGDPPSTPNQSDAKVNRAIQIVKDVVRLKKEGKYNIVGIDLAGDEAHNPVSEFKSAFDIIKDYNADPATHPDSRLGITIHAGETPSSKNPVKGINLSGWESVEHSIDAAYDERLVARGHNPMVRIGHGLQVINSSDSLRAAFNAYMKDPVHWNKQPVDIEELRNQSPLLRKIIDRKIVLEMCPKSNLQTYGIYPSFPDNPSLLSNAKYTSQAYQHHPAIFLSRLGVKVAISSDNRTISNTDVTNEFVKLYKYAGLSYKDFKTMVMNGFEGAFVARPTKKAQLLADVEKRFNEIETTPYFIKAMQEMGSKISVYQRLVVGGKTLRLAFHSITDALRERLLSGIEALISWLSRLPKHLA